MTSFQIKKQYVKSINFRDFFDIHNWVNYHVSISFFMSLDIGKVIGKVAAQESCNFKTHLHPFCYKFYQSKFSIQIQVISIIRMVLLTSERILTHCNIYVRMYIQVSMTSLLTHNVAHSTRHSFKPKKNFLVLRSVE